MDHKTNKNHQSDIKKVQPCISRFCAWGWVNDRISFLVNCSFKELCFILNFWTLHFLFILSDERQKSVELDRDQIHNQHDSKVLKRQRNFTAISVFRGLSLFYTIHALIATEEPSMSKKRRLSVCLSPSLQYDVASLWAKWKIHHWAPLESNWIRTKGAALTHTHTENTHT